MKTIAIILLCMCSLVGVGQKHDYVWVFGYDSNSSNEDSSTLGYKFGHAIVDFNYSPVRFSYDSLGMNFDRTCTSFSDDNGELLFYSNGIYIANKFDEKIANGDSLNGGYVTYVWDPSIMYYGYRLYQAIMALPGFAQDEYFLVHSFSDTTPGTYGTDLLLPTILHSKITLNQTGIGEVTSKNQPILPTGDWSFELAAIRHANGRDWWFIVQKRNSSCFKTVLLSPDGFQVMPDEYCIGAPVEHGQIGVVAFSPDGETYAYKSLEGLLKVFHFNRCEGKLENGFEIPISSNIGGLCFSPNSRFLYVSVGYHMLQLDMQATNIYASIDTVGIYDGYSLNGAPAFQGLFGLGQLGPDGKIYFKSGSFDVFHVINEPNERGLACDFQQHSIKLPALTLGIPHYPNYRLGALPGSACDTLTSIKDIAEKEKILKVFPNPASDVATIDYGYTDWSKGGVSLEIANGLGQVVHKQALPMYSGFQKLNVSNYPSGSYTVYIKRKDVVVAMGRLVRE